MHCERATLVALIRTADKDLEAARAARSTPRIVRHAREADALRAELYAYDAAPMLRELREKEVIA